MVGGWRAGWGPSKMIIQLQNVVEIASKCAGVVDGRIRSGLRKYCGRQMVWEMRGKDKGKRWDKYQAFLRVMGGLSKGYGHTMEESWRLWEGRRLGRLQQDLGIVQSGGCMEEYGRGMAENARSRGEYGRRIGGVRGTRKEHPDDSGKMGGWLARERCRRV